MSYSITTSIRLSSEVKNQLEQAAKFLHRKKNWIINEALQKYMQEIDGMTLDLKIREQSLRASQIENDEEKIWENNKDITGWI